MCSAGYEVVKSREVQVFLSVTKITIKMGFFYAFDELAVLLKIY